MEQNSSPATDIVMGLSKEERPRRQGVREEFEEEVLSFSVQTTKCTKETTLADLLLMSGRTQMGRKHNKELGPGGTGKQLVKFPCRLAGNGSSRAALKHRGWLRCQPVRSAATRYTRRVAPFVSTLSSANTVIPAERRDPEAPSRLGATQVQLTTKIMVVSKNFPDHRLKYEGVLELIGLLESTCVRPEILNVLVCVIEDTKTWVKRRRWPQENIIAYARQWMPSH